MNNNFQFGPNNNIKQWLKMHSNWYSIIKLNAVVYKFFEGESKKAVKRQQLKLIEQFNVECLKFAPSVQQQQKQRQQKQRQR